jgi:5-hydroxyisourate hydrolase
MSPITTHVLDTAQGKPAANLTIALEKFIEADKWEKLSSGKTNKDGRIADLLSEDHSLKAGIYRMNFDTKSYFDQTQTKSFYPFAHVIFEIFEGQEQEHFHVPLLLSPYGHSTYRGS